MLQHFPLLRVPFLVSAIFVAALSPARANGPAWTRADGAYYLRFGVTWLTASHEYGIDGRRHNLFGDSLSYRDAEFGQTDVALLCEYGLTDWLTGVAQTQLRTVVREAYYEPSARDTTISASGLTDLWLAARMRMLPEESPYRATVTLAWKAPMGSPTQEIPLGTGVADYSIGAAGAMPFELGMLTGHFQLASDFRLRNKASNEIGYFGEVSVDVGRGFELLGALDGTQSLADFGAEGVNRTMVGDRTYARWSLGLLLEADEGLDLGASFTDHFGGRNSLEATSFSLSATWRSVE
jgi:hypothetical protein